MRVTKEDYFTLLYQVFDGFIESEDFNDTLYNGVETIRNIDDIYSYQSDDIWSWLHDDAFVAIYINLTDEDKKDYIETHKDLLKEIARHFAFVSPERIEKAIKEKDYFFLEKVILLYYFSDAWEDYVYQVNTNDLQNIIADRDEHFQQEDEYGNISYNYPSEVELSDEEYDEGFDEALNRGLSVGKRKANLLSEGSKKGYKRF